MKKTPYQGIIRTTLPALIVAAATSAQAQDSSGWRLDPSLDVTGRIVLAETAIRDDEETIDGDAAALRLSPALELTNGDTSVTFRNATTRIVYFDEDRDGRWINTARLAVESKVADKVTLLGFGQRGDNLSTAEFFSTDQWEFGGRIESELDASNRLRLGASWRVRDYDDATSSSGEGPQIDGEYRYRLGANHFVTLRGRYEEINSANPLREMSRWSLFASYQRPIARDLRIRPEIAYRDLDYPGRLVAGGDYRRDDIVTPEVSLIYSPGPWQIIGEARYILRNSSDPAFDRSGYRFALEVTREL